MIINDSLRLHGGGERRRKRASHALSRDALTFRVDDLKAAASAAYRQSIPPQRLS